MLFEVAAHRSASKETARPRAILVKRAWDDYGYRTLFQLHYVSAAGASQLIGDVKILQKGSYAAELPTTFETLGEQYVSLGQDASYYGELRALGDEVNEAILINLKDALAAPEHANKFVDDPGFERSLLRFESARELFEAGLDATRRTLNTGVQVARSPLPTTFLVECDLGFAGPHSIRFHFAPEIPSGRIAILAGANGTGKTRFLQALAQYLSGLKADAASSDPPGLRAPVVALSFSAFDRFAVQPDAGESYRYFGLRGRTAFSERGHRWALSSDATERRLRNALVDVSNSAARKAAWFLAMRDLELFLREPQLPDPFSSTIDGFVAALGEAASGHQLLVFAVTGLLSSIQNGSVVVFDEPETHLHPRLLGRLVRALSTALEEFSAFCVMATHSPLLLQEVPAKSVYIFALEGRIPIVSRPAHESFGANLHELVNRAFGLQDDERQYAKTLRGLDAKTAELLFGNRLGLAARHFLEDPKPRKASK